MFNVVLVHPEIPPNTGNVIRLCANTGARLHLVEPLGFELDDAKLRRAGLDYHEWATVQVHANFEAVLRCARAAGSSVSAPATATAAAHADTPANAPASATACVAGSGRLFALSTRGTRTVFENRFEAGDWLVFGSESAGLPAGIRARFAPDHILRLPMRPDNRSLNLSNAVAVTVFEAWRQIGFSGSQKP